MISSALYASIRQVILKKWCEDKYRNIKEANKYGNKKKHIT